MIQILLISINALKGSYMRKISLSILLTVLTLPAFSQNHVLALNGYDAYVNFSTSIIDSPNFSISAWVYMEGPAGGPQEQSVIFEQREDATGCNHSAIVFFSEVFTDERIQRLSTRGDEECTVRVSCDSPPYGEWHHYAAVQAGDSSWLYQDGILRASNHLRRYGSFATNISNVSLGSHTHDGINQGLFNGMMDEISIWNVPLSAAQIQEQVDHPISIGQRGLIAYWNFEGSTTSVIDQTSYGHNGALRGGSEIILGEYSNPGPLWGDLNEDGEVNMSDVIRMIDHIMGN